jgi:TonB family protein
MRMCAMTLAIALVGFMPGIKVAANQPKESRPSVVQAVAPAYPPIAATAGATGTVTIEVRVKADGTVSSARVVKGVGVLAAAATSSARRWIFAVAESQASIRMVRLTFVFKIMPSKTPKDELLPIFKPPYQVEVRAIVPEGVDSVNRDPATQAPRKRTR